MAEFFKVNGVPFSIADGDFSETSNPVGTDDVMFSGVARRTRRNAKRREWRGSGIPMSPGRAGDLQAMIEGDGEVWTFDRATKEERGSKGHGARVGSTWTRVTSAPAPAHGAACIEVAAGDFFEADYLLPDNYTILVWKNELTGAPWASFSLDSNGAYSEGGVAGGANDPQDWIDVSVNGTPYLQGNDNTGSAADTRYDHLVVVPRVLDLETVLAYTGQSATPWGAPRAVLEGACLEDDSALVFGTMSTTKYLQGNLGDGAGFENNLRRAQFSLAEVIS